MRPALLVCAAQISTLLHAQLPAYQPAPGVQGQVRMVGSESMEPLMSYLKGEFQNVQPGVRIDLQSMGSGAAIQSLIAGETSLIFSSREMSPEETTAAGAKAGVALRLAFAIDALAIFVNPSCPLKAISVQDLDAIYSQERKAGRSTEVLTWGDLGARGDWAKRPLKAMTYDASSGTRALLQAKVLKGGAFKADLPQAADIWAAQEAVVSDSAVLSYGALSNVIKGVRVLDVVPEGGKNAVSPSLENLGSGSYPLSRFLFVYAAKKGLDAPTRAWLNFLFSDQGQKAVAAYKSVPVPEGLALANLNRLK